MEAHSTRAPEPIHPEAVIGRVRLRVADLERAVDYYTRVLRLETVARDGGSAELGAGGRGFLVLVAVPGARAHAGRTGLFHVAVLVPTRHELAAALHHIVSERATVSGAADHLVSEAIYLEDPDGNGIEIYRDRPRERWGTDAPGGIRMTTDPLDVAGLLSEPGSRETGGSRIHPGTRIGHVHLKVADVRAAESFYRDVLGFDLTARYGSAASFLAAGGYHHHIGVNSWHSAGAGPPPPGAAGLEWFEIRLPDNGELERVLARVKRTGVPLREAGGACLVEDPSRNRIVLTANR